MFNKNGQIEVRVGYTFSDGDNEYRAVMPWDCAICAFKGNPELCPVLACMCNERKDSKGVHFIKEGGENASRFC